MKAKLILVFISLLIPTLLFSQDYITDRLIDDVLAQIQQLKPDTPDAERQVQQLLAEFGFDFASPATMTKLSCLLRQDAPADMLRKFLLRMTVRDRNDRMWWSNGSQASLPITKANDQPLTAAEQAVITQVLEDFQVNENVGGGSKWRPAIAVAGSGNFVVVWDDPRNGAYDIYAQSYSSSGTPQGANFQVNDDNSNTQQGCSIAIDGNGNFVIIWWDTRNNHWDIYGQRYNNMGQKYGLNFQANEVAGISCVSILLEDPINGVGIDGSGNFVVVWFDDRNGNRDIYAQCYSSSSMAQGRNFRINDDNSSHYKYDPAIAIDHIGNFMVVWEDYRNGGDIDIYAQRYNSSADTQGANFRVNDDSFRNSQYSPNIAVDGVGNIMVVWMDYRNGHYDIYAQRYNNSGMEQGANSRVNDDSGSSFQLHPAIAADRSGNLVVVWEDYRNSDPDIYAQLFDSQGQAIGSN